jgi:hypothetical protein
MSFMVLVRKTLFAFMIIEIFVYNIFVKLSGNDLLFECLEVESLETWNVPILETFAGYL